MEIMQPENFNSICRICFGTDSLSLISEIIYEDKYLSEILWECTSIQISKEDQLPNKICLSCIQSLCNVYKFLNLCHDGNIMLHSAISDSIEDLQEKNLEENIIIKIENEDEIKSDKNRDTEITESYQEENTDGNFSCHECNESFTTLFEFIYHFHTILHTKNENICPLCRTSFQNLKNFKRHLYYHSGWYKCNLCERKFNFFSNLKKHVYTHGGKHFLCELCGKGLRTAWSLHDHLASHTKEKWCICHKCGKQFSKFSKFYLHMKAHDIKPAHLCKKKYDCVFCNKRCRTFRFLKIHLMAHIEVTPSVEVTPEREYIDPRRVECQVCNKTFKSKYVLEAHLKLHSDERPYSCFCGKTFRLPYNLKVHERVHTGEKPYVCTVCSKCFAQKQQLNTHMRTHTLEKPYTCNFCSKAFATRGNATVHMRLHTGETPFTCTVCSKGYVDSSGLKRHRCTLPYGNSLVFCV